MSAALFTEIFVTDGTNRTRRKRQLYADDARVATTVASDTVAYFTMAAPGQGVDEVTEFEEDITTVAAMSGLTGFTGNHAWTMQCTTNDGVVHNGTVIGLIGTAAGVYLLVGVCRLDDLQQDLEAPLLSDEQQQMLVRAHEYVALLQQGQTVDVGA